MLLLLLLRHPATPWYAVPARVPIGLIPVPDPLDNPPLVCCAMHNTQPSYRRTRTTYHQRLKTGANSLLF